MVGHLGHKMSQFCLPWNCLLFTPNMSEIFFVVHNPSLDPQCLKITQKVVRLFEMLRLFTWSLALMRQLTHHPMLSSKRQKKVGESLSAAAAMVALMHQWSYSRFSSLWNNIQNSVVRSWCHVQSYSAGFHILLLVFSVGFHSLLSSWLLRQEPRLCQPSTTGPFRLLILQFLQVSIATTKLQTAQNHRWKCVEKRFLAMAGKTVISSAKFKFLTFAQCLRINQYVAFDFFIFGPLEIHLSGNIVWPQAFSL